MRVIRESCLGLAPVDTITSRMMSFFLASELKVCNAAKATGIDYYVSYLCVRYHSSFIDIDVFVLFLYRHIYPCSEFCKSVSSYNWFSMAYVNSSQPEIVISPRVVLAFLSRFCKASLYRVLMNIAHQDDEIVRVVNLVIGVPE